VEVVTVVGRITWQTRRRTPAQPGSARWCRWARQPGRCWVGRWRSGADSP